MKNIPYGYCNCGCGQKTSIAKDRHRKFIKGHNTHIQYGKNNPSWNGGKTKDKNGRVLILSREHPKANSKGYVYRHRLIAEKVLGKYLPDNVVVHHNNGDPSKDENNNLVICENDIYHHLLHQRERAFKACGHANWRKCKYCKQYDNPENLKISKHTTGNAVYHKICRRKYLKEWGERRKNNGH